MCKPAPSAAVDRRNAGLAGYCDESRGDNGKVIAAFDGLAPCHYPAGFVHHPAR